MAMRDLRSWKTLLERKPLDTIIETGTYRAVNTIMLSGLFQTVHSIEMSKTLYDEAVEKCKGVPNIHLYNGDSALVLPSLSIAQPAYYFLDAHWCLTKPAATQNNCFPLWRELEFLSNRPYSDVIIVDDVHAFENKGVSTDNKRYHNQWNGVNKVSILEAISMNKQIVECFEFEDVFVVYV